MSNKSVFSLQEQESITIEKFIFHIIIADDDSPKYLKKVNLNKGQKEFFTKRFIDASTGTKFRFIDKENSTFFEQSQKMFKSNEEFLAASKKISSSFHSVHRRSANDGVFILSVVSIVLNNQPLELAFLIKMDHRAVYQYKLKEGVATLEEIINTVVEEKSAMQKVAIIDLSNHYSWDVLATDRTKAEDIAGYFKDFLNVIELEPDSLYTRAVVNKVRSWANINKPMLPERVTPQDFKDKAIDYMKGNSLFKSDDFVEIVTSSFEDEVTTRNIQLEDSLRAFLRENELYGIEFKPRPNSLRTKEYKNRITTGEGVYLEWSGSKNTMNLTIPDQRDSSDNLFHIVIKTGKILT